MKKLLIMLTSISLIAGGTINTIACNSNSNSNNSDHIGDKINQWYKVLSASPIIINESNYNNVSESEVLNIIQNQFNTLSFKSDYKLNPINSDFSQINFDYNNKRFNPGDFSFLITNIATNADIVNSNTKSTVFSIKFNTINSDHFNAMFNILNPLNKHVPELDFDFNKIQLGNLWRTIFMMTGMDIGFLNGNNSHTLLFEVLNSLEQFTLSGLLKMVPNLIPWLDKSGNIIPNPDSDGDWNVFIDKITDLLKNFKIIKNSLSDISFNKNYNINNVLHVHIEFNLGRLINGIAPDIVHFANFLKVNFQHKNLLLAIIQYFFSPKQDIMMPDKNGHLVPDGFSFVNKGTSTIKTNLDNLMYDLFGYANIWDNYTSWFNSDASGKKYYFACPSSIPPVYVYLGAFSQVEIKYHLDQKGILSLINYNEVLPNLLLHIIKSSIAEPFEFDIVLDILHLKKQTIKINIDLSKFWLSQIKNYLSNCGLNDKLLDTDQLILQSGHALLNRFDIKTNAWVEVKDLNDINLIFNWKETNGIRFIIPNAVVQMHSPHLTPITSNNFLFRFL